MENGSYILMPAGYAGWLFYRRQMQANDEAASRL